MKWTWNKPLGLPECPYINLWMVDFGLFALRLHKWSGSDDDRYLHDHPWWFLTFMLKGSYVDVSKAGNDTLTAGSIRFRWVNHAHTVKLVKKPTWTFLITGKPLRRWGFWVGGKLLRRDTYFSRYGHHPCNAGGAPVRINPQGQRR